MRKSTSLLLAIGLSAGTILAGCGDDEAVENNGTSNTEESTENNESTTDKDAVTEDSAGGGGAGDTNTADNGSEVDLDVGVDTVLTDLDSLNTVLESTPDDVAKINELGNQIESHWDLFEQKVEKEFPDEYADIEKDLYPLIEEAKKDEPDVAKLNRYLDESVMKLTSFKDKLPQ